MPDEPDEEIDDLEEEPQLDTSFKQTIVVDGLPVVPEEKHEKLLNLLRKFFSQVSGAGGRVDASGHRAVARTLRRVVPTARIEPQHVRAWVLAMALHQPAPPAAAAAGVPVARRSRLRLLRAAGGHDRGGRAEPSQGRVGRHARLRLCPVRGRGQGGRGHSEGQRVQARQVAHIHRKLV
eukprot:scaffold24189_cov100-Isochrysis_galbana.AAC.2